MNKSRKKEQKSQKILTFGQRFHKVRKDIGLNQSELAQRLGFSANTIISRFEKDKSLPSVEVLLVLARDYKIDLHWLLTGNPSPEVAEVLKELMPFIYDNQIKTLLKIGQLSRKRKELQANGQDAARLQNIEDELEELHRYSTDFWDTVSAIQKKYQL